MPCSPSLAQVWTAHNQATLWNCLQGPVLIAEMRIKRWAKARGFALPLPVSIFLWDGVLMVLGILFWYPPIERDTKAADLMVARIVENGHNAGVVLQQYARAPLALLRGVYGMGGGAVDL